MKSKSVFIFLMFCSGFGTFSLSGCGSGSGSGSGTGSGGGGSVETNPVPTLTALSPNTGIVGTYGEFTVTGSNFVSGATILADGAAWPTTFLSASELKVEPQSLISSPTAVTITVSNPVPGGGTSNPLILSFVGRSSNGIISVGVIDGDLVWDPVSQLIYIITCDSNGTGTGIQTLDPNTGALGVPVSLNGNPSLIALSANSKYVYVSLDESSSIQRLTLPGLVPDITIPLGSNSAFTYVALDLQASPTSDKTVAVSRGTAASSYRDAGGAVIYDDSNPRPNYAYDGELDSIQWNSDGTKMFAARTETENGGDFYTLPVSASGFGPITVYNNLIPKEIASIKFDPTTGNVYTNSGWVVDPNNGSLIGEFPAYDWMVPDGANGVAYFLWIPEGEQGGFTFNVSSFDINTFQPIASVSIYTGEGWPVNFVRCGNSVLAFPVFTPAGIFSTTSPAEGLVYLVPTSLLVKNGSITGTKGN